MAYFKPGDRVTIRRDLIPYDKRYYMDNGVEYNIATYEMQRMRSQTVTIHDIEKASYALGNYTVRESGYYWTDEMFEEYINRSAVPLDIGQAAGECDIMNMLYGTVCDDERV